MLTTIARDVEESRQNCGNCASEALAWARNESYEPLAAVHRRSARRRARLTPPVIVRLLMILFLVAAIYWLRK